MTYVESINKALDEMLASDPRSLVCGQLVKWGCAGVTNGLFEKYPKQVITYPVSEALMNASAMGLALAGTRVVMIHERMDFVAVGMDALVNHIPIWPRKCGVDLPLTIVGIVGKGHGQGAQHSKDLTNWFSDFEGWAAYRADSVARAYGTMRESTRQKWPVFCALYRELFSSSEMAAYRRNSDIIGLCGAGESYERAFYR